MTVETYDPEKAAWRSLVDQLHRAGWPAPLVIAAGEDAHQAFAFFLQLKNGTRINFERATFDATTPEWVELAGWSMDKDQGGGGELCVRLSEIAWVLNV